MSGITSRSPTTPYPDGFVDMLSPEYPEVRVIGLAYLVVCSCLITAGNLFVIVSVIKFPRLQKPNHVVVCSLAVADFLIGCLVLPLVWTNEVIVDFWHPFGCLFFLTFNLGLTLVSVLHLLTLNLERYIAITRPLEYHKLITKRTVTIALLSVWISGLLPVSVYLWIDGLEYDSPFYCSTHIYKWRFYVVYSFLTFWIPFPIACFICLKIYRIARKHSTAIAFSFEAAHNVKRSVFNSSTHRHRIMVTEKSDGMRRNRSPPTATVMSRSSAGGQLKAVRMIAMVLGSFALSIGFSFATPLVMGLQQEYSKGPLPRAQIEVGQITFMLSFFNSWLNPIIYGLHTKEFRLAFKRIVRCGRSSKARGVFV